MARFNPVSQGTVTTNLAGGTAFTESPELELVSLLLTSFANDQFYQKADTSFDRLKELITKCDKKFVAQAAVYARTKFGMRSISHVAASELAKHIKGQPWAKAFYSQVINRPDDIVEILAYHKSKNGKITNPMRKGLGVAFGRFDTYQLAKYRCENRALTLKDAMNIVHPIPTERNKEALMALKNGTLKSTDTWESALTVAGQEADGEESKGQLKKEAWDNLIKSRRLGYFALLKNLRNIIEQAPESVPSAIEMLTDEKLIKKSLVLPFRYITAYDEIQKMQAGPQARIVMVALAKAVDLSLGNVPKLDGETLVVLDVSGSMTSGDAKPARIGSLFAAALVKANNCDFVTFDTHARYINLNPGDTITTISGSIPFTGGGTDFHSIFRVIKRNYKRIIILSDMQGWIGRSPLTQSLAQYKQTFKADPIVYSFDLAGYGTLQFPERNVYTLAGFSDKIFDLMKMLETDKNVLINEIKGIDL